MALVVKNLPANAGRHETRVQSLGWKDPLEEEMTTLSNIAMARDAWWATFRGVAKSQTQLSD